MYITQLEVDPAKYGEAISITGVEGSGLSEDGDSLIKSP